MTIAQLFFPMEQQPSRGLNVVARTAVDPASLLASVQQAIRSVDATIPVASGTTLKQQVERTLAPRRFHTGLLATFAGVALLLAGTGIFGLMHFSVARRTHEIGVRSALGATGGQILREILREGLLLAGVGVVLGIGGAIALLRSLSSLLFEVGTVDPWSLAAAGGTLILVAAIGCLLPAFRASRIDPIIALRAE